MRFARGRWRAAPNAVIRVDTKPPTITADLPAGRTIAFGADGDNGLYRYTVASNEAASAWPTVFSVSADGTVDEVWRPEEPVALAVGKATELSWPAANRTPDRPADDGTYLAGYEVRDAAGNIVRSPASFTPGDTGTAAAVRVQALEITPSRRILTFDAQVQVAQQLLTDGLPGVQVGERTGPPAAAVPRAPTRAGLYGLRVSGSRTTTWGYQPVAGKAVALVVLPTYTWQLDNPYDAAGDGFPDVAPAAQDLDRPLGDGARVGLEELLRLAGTRRWPPRAAAVRSPTSGSRRRASRRPPGSSSCPPCASGRRACATACAPSSPPAGASRSSRRRSTGGRCATATPSRWRTAPTAPSCPASRRGADAAVKTAQRVRRGRAAPAG